MTTEERIAELEKRVDGFMENRYLGVDAAAIVSELRALRLMLREELREAAWRLGARAMTDEQAGAFIRAMGEPRPYDQEAVPERLIEAVEGKDVP